MKVAFWFFNLILLNLISMPLTGEEMKTPDYLYRIVSPEQWEESQQKGYVVPSELDQGFIHLSKEDQVKHVAQKFWNGKEYLVLKLASNKLVGRLVYEKNPGGSTLYYHLYDGKIPLEAVVEAKRIKS